MMSWSGYDAPSASKAAVSNVGALVGMACTWTMSEGTLVFRNLPSHHDDQPASGLAAGQGIGCVMPTSTLAWLPLSPLTRTS